MLSAEREYDHDVIINKGLEYYDLKKSYLRTLV